jgi:hypothetical protein
MHHVHLLLAADRMRERIREAEDHRLARAARAASRAQKSSTRTPTDRTAAGLASGSARGA